MERLTEDSVTGETYIKQCASSCPYDGDFCGTDECPVLNAVADKLGEYERAEEQGLLMRLSCKVGTEVFCFFPGDSHYTKCQIKKNRNLSKHIWKYMLLCRASWKKGMLLQIF